jgi:hypothetical protein
MPMTDETVRGTNDDALISKLSAVQAGYLDDPFVKAFISRGPKRLPLINLGTYIRTTEIDRLIALNSPCQMVSFGAGSDTRPFRLKLQLYIELDFPEVVSLKSFKIQRSLKTAQPLVTESHVSQGVLRAPGYIMYPCDLRNWDPIHQFLKDTLDPTYIYLTQIVYVILV